MRFFDIIEEDVSEKELKEFLPEIKKMDKKSKKTFVFFNNCHAGKAIQNAMMLKKLLEAV